MLTWRFLLARALLLISSEAVDRILVNSYKVPVLSHYLDDFTTAGPLDSPQCAENLSN